MTKIWWYCFKKWCVVIVVLMVKNCLVVSERKIEGDDTTVVGRCDDVVVLALWAMIDGPKNWWWTVIVTHCCWAWLTVIVVVGRHLVLNRYWKNWPTVVDEPHWYCWLLKKWPVWKLLTIVSCWCWKNWWYVRWHNCWRWLTVMTPTVVLEKRAWLLLLLVVVSGWRWWLLIHYCCDDCVNLLLLTANWLLVELERHCWCWNWWHIVDIIDTADYWYCYYYWRRRGIVKMTVMT